MRKTRALVGCSGLLLAGMAVLCTRPLHAQEWHELSPKERYDALQNYWRYQRLPEDRQRDVDKGYERWRNMPPNERQRVRQNYERLRQLRPQERERFERKYQKWRQQGGTQR